jgi:hypothetical protein
VKKLSTWDTYVQEAAKKGDRSIELPLTQDEVYVIQYPTRRQGREIQKAQLRGDTDALLVAMLGEQAGTRVQELAEDQPQYVLDEFLVDVLKKFGMIQDDENEKNPEDSAEDTAESVDGEKASPGKSSTPKSKTPSKRSSAVSS